MASLEEQMNALSDKDWTWWPFLHLRPARTERMTKGLVAKLAGAFALVFGIPCGVPVAVIAYGVHRPGKLLLGMEGFLLALAVLFFCFYRVTFAACWNARAERLALEVASKPTSARAPPV